MPDYQLITNLIFEPKGAHDPTITYTIKDTVTSSDGSVVYFALKDVPLGIPLTDTEYWCKQIDLSASKNAMDSAAATAKTQTDAVTKSAQDRVDNLVDTASDAIVNLNDYTEQYGLRVRGETQKASGDIIEIYPDAGSLLKPVTTIKVKQQGSGDPYPMGGGRNKLVNTATSHTVNGITITVNADRSITVKGTATSNTWIHVNEDTGLSAGDYILSGCAGGSDSTYFLYVEVDGTTVAESKTGESAFSVPEGATVGTHIVVISGTTVSETFYPMIRLASEADATYAPPSNIRPFIGYDKLGLMRHGKNLISPPKNNFSPTADFEYSEDSGVLKVIKTADVGVDRGQLYYELEVDASRYAGQMITLSHSGFSCTYSGESPVILLYNQDASVLIAAFYIAEQNSKTAQLPADCTKLRIVVRIDDANSAPSGTVLTLNGLQLEVGSTPSAFTPYQGKLYTVQIGQTVYGIRYEWLTGKGVIEWAMKTLDGTEGIETFAGWSVGSYRVFFDLSNAYLKADENDINEYLKCSHTVSQGVGPIAVLNVQGIGITAVGATINLGAQYTTVDAFRALIAAQNAAGTPVQILYKLANPIEIQLAPTAVLTTETEGVNYVYGDGDIEVEYVIPLNQSIAKRVNMLLDTFAEPFEQTGDIVTCEPVAGIEFDSVVSTIEPQQQGSGDPYPAGGGKNLLNYEAWKKVSTYNGVFVFENNGVTITADGDDAFTLWDSSQPCVIPINPGETVVLSWESDENYDGIVYVFPNGSPDNAVNSNNANAKYVVYTAGEGVSYFTFRFGVSIRGQTIHYKNIQIEKGSVPTSFAPSENVRPFIGYDKLELVRSGKNLCPGVKSGAYGNSDGICAAFEGYYCTEKIMIPEGIAFKVSNSLGVNADDVHCWDVNGNWLGRSNWYESPPSGAKYIAFNYYSSTPLEWVQLELGSAATDYKPYQSKLHTVHLGQTVYGFRYEWLTGKGMIEWVMATFDGSGDEGWSLYEYDQDKASVFNYNVDALPGIVDTGNLLIPGFCSWTASAEGSLVDIFRASTNSPRMEIPHETLSKWGITGGLDIFKDKLAANPMQIVYKLANPIEIQLTPTEIIALSGVNTLYGDGKITVTGRQSKTLNLEDRVAALENAVLNL